MHAAPLESGKRKVKRFRFPGKPKTHIQYFPLWQKSCEGSGRAKSGNNRGSLQRTSSNVSSGGPLPGILLRKRSLMSSL